jgi:thymidylate synthase (FAD)
MESKTFDSDEIKGGVGDSSYSPYLESILDKSYPVLDHGFVRMVDYMGTDYSITQAARISYGRGTKSVNSDGRLIRYLMKNNHTSPFEMCEIKLHIKAPYFVARQWLRHRTAHVNEYSGRYSLVENQYYVPNADRIQCQSKINKQGSGASISSSTIVSNIIETIIEQSKNAYSSYNTCIQSNLTRELSRINLSLNYYTEFYWKIDLHNLLHFLKLRLHSSAQYEIRMYADVILNIVKQWVPLTYSAFVEYKLDSVVVSRKGMSIIMKLFNELRDDPFQHLTEKEYNDLMVEVPCLKPDI